MIKIMLNSDRTMCTIYLIKGDNVTVKFKDLGMTWQQGVNYLLEFYGARSEKPAA